MLTLLSSFFSGSLRSPVIYEHITCIHTSKFNVQYGTVIFFFLYFPYPNYEKNPISHLLIYWKGIFIFFLSRLHDFTPFMPKIFWGRTPEPPPPRHIYNIKITMSSVCMCRDAFNCTKKTLLQIKLNVHFVNNWLESRFKPSAETERERKNNLNPLFSFLFFFFFFFFFFLLVKNFRKVGTPLWQKYLDPRLCIFRMTDLLIRKLLQ